LPVYPCVALPASGQQIPSRFSVCGFPLHACPACPIEFLYPQPDDAAMEAISSDRHFPGELSEEAAARRPQMKSATRALYVDALASYRHPHVSTSSMMAIGRKPAA
jgi:hypothetical protein